MHISVRDETQHVRSADVNESIDCVTLGASPDCHVYLPDIRIADQHLRLEKRTPHSWTLRIGDIPGDSPAVFTRIYVNALEVEDGQVRYVRTRIIRELRSFARMWDRNIPLQGFLDLVT